MGKTDRDGVSQPEEMIAKLCQVDILARQGLTTMEALKAIGLRLETYRHWRDEVEELMLDEAARLKVLEVENAELRRAVTDLVLRTASLREEVARGDGSRHGDAPLHEPVHWRPSTGNGAIAPQK